MRFLLIPLLCLTFSLTAAAIGVDKDRLSDPEQEARAQSIMKQLRCLVCQNQSIVESDAGLAVDLRGIVREQVKAGQSDRQILHFMTSRYGDWVLLQPPFKAATLLLWLGPLFLLLIGGYFVFRYVRQKPTTVLTEPLTADEEKRLQQILRENDT
ncbi:MAG: cytochrome C biogenesis protein CcmH [Alphaproteobacteria bacterium]|nr:MAG: cytochrome C biogenesis protein CcmH [Alphaproteobacteria bacterium]